MVSRRAIGVAGVVLAVVTAALAWWFWWPTGPGADTPSASTSPGLEPTAMARPTAPDSSPTPSPSPSAMAWGPTEHDWREAQAAAAALSLEQAAGQVIVAGISDPSASAAAALVADLDLAGVVLLGGAITDEAGVRELTDAVHAAVADRDWGAIVAVDQEGGTVARVRGFVPDLPGFMAAGAASDPAAVEAAFTQAGVDLVAMGFTLDLAPVADVTIGLADPTIRTRSAGSDPDRVADTVEAAVSGLTAGGLASAVKHFPGHGSVTVDSHDALPRQDAALAELEARDFVPFVRAVETGVPVLMMGHVTVPDWGDGPATLEPAAYEYVRDQLGFEGVIVTDALTMGAIEEDSDGAGAAVGALAAGADLILMPEDPAAAHAAIVEAVREGTVPRERLNDAVARGILLGRWQRSLASASDDDSNYGRTLAAAGVTVSAADCAAPWVGEQVRLSGGREVERDALGRALAERGVGIVNGDGSGGDAQVTHIALLGTDDGTASADVVVALGGPWGLEDSTADVYVGLYGRSADALEGLADVLTGEVAPSGTWPVALDLPGTTCSG